MVYFEIVKLFNFLIQMLRSEIVLIAEQLILNNLNFQRVFKLKSKLLILHSTILNDLNLEHIHHEFCIFGIRMISFCNTHL